MGWKRVWDKSCPRIYNKWEKDGDTWTIEDLHPEDDQTALDLLLSEFLPDEHCLGNIDAADEKKSIEDAKKFWGDAISQRMTLVCYRHVGGKREILAMNVCTVRSIEDEPEDTDTGSRWSRVVYILKYLDTLTNLFDKFGVQHYLTGAGLLVSRKGRGHGLAAKVLQAREPLCRLVGIKAAATTFSGPAAQKSAAKAGYTILHSHTMKEFKEVGIDIEGSDPEHRMALMIHEYK